MLLFRSSGAAVDSGKPPPCVMLAVGDFWGAAGSAVTMQTPPTPAAGLFWVVAPRFAAISCLAVG